MSSPAHARGALGLTAPCPGEPALGDLGLNDPEVPGVAVIADSGALSGLLAGVGEELLGRSYRRYKPGTSLIAGLRLASGPAFTYAVSAEARPKLAKLVERAPHGAVLVNSTSLLVARPAADRDLPALADPGRLSAAVGRPVETWTTLTYKPQRRWVGRPEGDPCRTGLMLRAYRPGELPAAMAGWRLAGQLAAAGIDGVRLPTTRTVSARRGLAVVSWLSGTPLDHVLSDQSRTSPSEVVLAEVGAALAHLHDALPPGTADIVVDTQALRPVLSELSAVLPALRRRTVSMLQALEARAPRIHGSRPIHGDFSADQVIVAADGRIGVTDWDRAGWGDPGADLGSLRAAGMSETAYAAVLDGYARVRAVPASTEWHGVAAAAQRLTEPLRRGREEWRSEIVDRLGRAEEQLEALVSRPGGKCV